MKYGTCNMKNGEEQELTDFCVSGLELLEKK